MSKGLRLSFCGTTCTAHEIKVMAHALGYDTMPVFYGWGKRGGYRNFFGINPCYESEHPDCIACKSLVEKGLMWVENAPIVSESLFHLTKKGMDWFSRFRRNHPHADFKKQKK